MMGFGFPCQIRFPTSVPTAALLTTTIVIRTGKLRVPLLLEAKTERFAVHLAGVTHKIVCPVRPM